MGGNTLVKNTLVHGIIALFIVSAVSPMVIGLESNTINCEINQSGMDRVCYGYCIYDPSGELTEGPVTFSLEDPQNITQLWETSSPSRMTGGAWWYDGWFSCEYGSGDLWRIDFDSGYMMEIGGGGDNLNGLDRFHGVHGSSNTSLYEIDEFTGEQTLIGEFDFPEGRRMGSITYYQGCLLGVEYVADQLYEIDPITGGLSYIGPLGIDIDSTAELEDLYLSSKGVLYKVDMTGECTLVGEFQGGAEISALVIEPVKHYLPRANFSWEPLNPQIGDTILFNASSSYSVPHNIVLYEWDWDNNLLFDENSTSPITSYMWDEKGLYPVTLLVHDDYNSFDTQRYIINVGNQPPNKPEIDGPTSGRAGVEYNYNISAEDPNGDNVTYYIHWGDSCGGHEWYGPYPSGEEIIVFHYYSDEGTFIINLMAVDEYGAESEWTYLEVTMPKNQNMQFGWLESFPLLQRLLSLPVFNRMLSK